MQNPILLIGTARSGLGLIAEVLHMCGGFGGCMAGVDLQDEKGFYENVQIRERLIIPLLKAQTIDPKGQYPLKELEPTDIAIENLKAFNSNLLAKQGRKDERAWFYSDFRNVLAWRLWHEAYPQAKWILIERSFGDIVESCLKTGHMQAFKNPAIQNMIGVTNERDGWIWWVNEYYKIIGRIRQTVPYVFVLSTKALKEQDYTGVRQLIEWTGLEWDDAVEQLLIRKIKK